MSNLVYPTIGLESAVIGSTKTFMCRPRLNGLPWNLTLGTAYFQLADPLGNFYSLSAQIVGGGYAAAVNYEVIGPGGSWTYCWNLTDVTGNNQISSPYLFQVISSPVTPNPNFPYVLTGGAA